MTGPYWDDQFNVTRGCSPASPGCDHCWARTMHERFRSEPFEQVTLLPEALSKPLHRRKPTTYFVCNTSDLYHPSVPFEFVAAVYGVMAACPQHTFLVLTKRPDRRAEFMKWVAERAEAQCHTDPKLPCHKATLCWTELSMHVDMSKHRPIPGYSWTWPLLNVWEGVTVCTQAEMDRVAKIINPNYRWWISLEPALEHVDLKCPGCSGTVNDHMGGDQGGCSGAFPSQIIIGGESGPGARPFDLAWARSMARQCKDAGVPCYVKQLGSRPVGEWGENPPTYHLTDITVQPPIESVELSRTKGGVWKMRSRSGSDPSEWPSDLQARELAWNDIVKVWNRGGLAGELTLVKGDGEELARRMAGPGTTVSITQIEEVGLPEGYWADYDGNIHSCGR